MINTMAPLQQIPTQLEAATMGCRLETPNNSYLKGWLTYPDSLLAELEHYIGGAKGRKNFRANEVTTAPNGELNFQLTPDPTKAIHHTPQTQALHPITEMATPQDSPPSKQGKMDGQLVANTNGEEREKMDIYI